MSLSHSSQSAGPTPLQYSQRRPLRFFSRHPRLLVLAAFFIALGVSWYLWWTPLQYRIRWYYWTRQAMNYQMPVTSLDVRIVDQAQAKALPAANPDFALFESPVRVDAVFAPKAFRALSELDSRIRTVGQTSGNWNHYGAISFIGALKRPDGEVRLVIIPGSESVSLGFPVQGLGYLVMKPPELLDTLPAKITSPGLAMMVSGSGAVYQTKTAIRDPADPTHLIIPLNNYFKRSPYQVDAYLLNDDTLSIRINKAAPRPTTAGDTFIEIRTSIIPTTKSSATLGCTQSNPGLIRPPTTKPATSGIR